MFRFALKCLHLDKNGKNIYENEMCKLINIFYPLVDSSHSQSKLSQWPSFQKIKTLKNQQFFFYQAAHLLPSENFMVCLLACVEY